MTIKFETIIISFLASAVIGIAISYSKLYLFHIMLAILLGSFIYFKTNNFKIKIAKLPTRYHEMFYLMFIWYFASLMWSWNRTYTFQYVTYIFFGIAIVLAVVYYANDLLGLNRLFRVLSTVFIIEIMLCLLEGLTPFRLPISPFSSYVTYFGREMKIDSDLAADVLAVIMRGPTGFQWNPNNLCTVLNIICPFFLFYNKTHIKILGTLSILLIILMVASRTNLVAFLVMLVLYSFCYSKSRAIKTVAWLIPITVVFVISFSAIEKYAEADAKLKRSLSAFEAAKVYLSGEINGDDSVGIRQQLIKNGINALASTYGLGVGGGASKTVQEVALGLHDTTSMHNFWVEMLVEGGIAFAALFYLWYAKLAYSLYAMYWSTKDLTLRYYSASSSLSMAVFTIGAISCSSVIYDLPIWILFGFSIATLNIYKRTIYETNASCGSKQFAYNQMG